MNSIYEFRVKNIQGQEIPLAEYKGRVLLIVNVASKCGFTPQYSQLQSLFRKYRDQEFVVLGFPSNDFLKQEPGSNAEILEFCETQFGVEFPLFEKISVSGPQIHPLYQFLTSFKSHALNEPGSKLRSDLRSLGINPGRASDVLWNFEKFLVARDGKVTGRFAPDVDPTSQLLTDAIEKELKGGRDLKKGKVSSRLH
ncbi:MAG: glutathione peroxidase [Bdellovibrionales bacterium]